MFHLRKWKFQNQGVKVDGPQMRKWTAKVDVIEALKWTVFRHESGRSSTYQKSFSNLLKWWLKLIVVKMDVFRVFWIDFYPIMVHDYCNNLWFMIADVVKIQEWWPREFSLNYFRSHIPRFSEILNVSTFILTCPLLETDLRIVQDGD